MFISIIFCLPTANPVTSKTLNYTVVAVGIIAFFSLGSWMLWARRWFVGPMHEIQEAQRLHVDLLEPGALERAEMEAKERGKLDGSDGKAELGGEEKHELDAKTGVVSDVK